MTCRKIQEFQVNLGDVGVSYKNQVNMTYFILMGPSHMSIIHPMGTSMYRVYPWTSRESDSILSRST